MKQLSLIIRDINRLNLVRARLINKKPLSSDQRIYLANFLSQLPSEENLLSNKIPLDFATPVVIWDMEKSDEHLQKWVALFRNIPDFEGSTTCFMTNEREKVLLEMHTVIITMFSPTLTYAMNLETIAPDDGGFEVHLKDDGTAYFKLHRLEEAEQYPELYNFRGNWKQAYLLLIETLKKGWPMEEFPEELQKFLPKN